MLRRRVARIVALAGLVGAGMMLAGCRVDEHKNGNDENVKIATPFGGLSVQTNGAASPAGLDVYPGAVAEQKEKGSDGAANVNLSFGSFHLGVKAAAYTTPDPPSKVLAYYKSGMAKYGVVIQCLHHRPVGTPTQTSGGLTCAKDGNHDMQVNHDDDDDSDKTELKAGSHQHQHVVEVRALGTGTKFGLVAIDLPGNFNVSDSDDKQ